MTSRWFRLYTDFLDDPKIISLAYEDQRHYVGILCLKAAGLLDSGATPTVQDRIAAQRLWVDYAIIGDVKKRLKEAGLIDNNWQPIAWDKRQFKSDHDITTAERQRRYREKHRNALHNALGNGTVTLPDTETDTDTDTEKTYTAKPAGKPARILPSCPVQKVIDLYNQTFPTLPQAVVRSDARDGHIKARWRQFFEAGDFQDEAGGLACFEWYFKNVTGSKFLMGQAQGRGDRKPFQADLSWLMKPENFAKVIEGRYA